ncbi:ISAs1 family transposase [Streptomyces capitiformicae]|uniref:ISAs1 family transposase n=2 Tax=Streptomyces capitiformicae TaxID=2014920 RepID=UPI001E36DDA6|nr:ISAs1 family transposase [Streptomyces capitiformicae]
MLVKLGPLDTGRIADLRPYFDSVPDPRARRGRWYSLTAILLVCACAVVSGAKSIDELAEWGKRASNALLTVLGFRRHLLRWRRTPSPATIGRVLGAVDGDALDRAVGAYLADRRRAATEPARAPSPSASGRTRAIAVDGKALKGSARLTAMRRHPLSAVTHGTAVTLAQAEVGAKTNETTHFQPLLARLGLTGTVVTFDALHSVKANISWLVETKKAHYIAVVKTNQCATRRFDTSPPQAGQTRREVCWVRWHSRAFLRALPFGLAFPTLSDRFPIRFPRRFPGFRFRVSLSGGSDFIRSSESEFPPGSGGS